MRWGVLHRAEMLRHLQLYTIILRPLHPWVLEQASMHHATDAQLSNNKPKIMSKDFGDEAQLGEM